MAILYGTTADGDSLPVEVNEFGQLIAQGLQGQEGPPGPPGLPELPPDPFEGAILGWKDNTLSWLGGSVPLPVGTYGPITAYQGGVLTLASTVDLPYLAKFFLSNKFGAEFSWAPSSSAIVNVGEISDWNQSEVWSGQIAGTVYSGVYGKTNAFDGNTVSTMCLPLNNSTLTFTPSPSFANAKTVKIYYYYPTATVNAWKINGASVGNDLPITSEVLTYTFDVSKTGFTSLAWSRKRHGDEDAGLRGIEIDGILLVDTGIPGSPTSTLLTLQNSDGLSAFAVGDVVQEGVSITAISESTPSITTDGGKWRGTDGSGDLDGERTVIGPEIIGQGSVQSVVGNAIVLREDNGGWKIGEYITTTDMKIAARYVVASKRRQATDP